MAKTDLVRVIKSLSDSIPGIFLTLPFFGTLSYLDSARPLVDSLAKRLACDDPQDGNRILWFTDTLNDLNGVSVTLKEIGWLAHARGSEMKIATSLLPSEVNETIPPNVVNLPFIHQFRLPCYES
jgi:hypothetical protein